MLHGKRPRPPGYPDEARMPSCPRARPTEPVDGCAVLIRLRLLLISFSGGLLLLLLLCLGAQNLQDRHTLQIGGQRSVPLPTGFLVGIAMVIGVISGGTATAVLLPDQRDRFD